ncbi:hypothetical protein [Burkholderia gladioli]|uniref:hypothetical protein n=1 Tax=Burkholderia gladioli TaxID=28095 RepID=UPI0016412225|nr:hypothetical protein [Burkholderia gladioli]
MMLSLHDHVDARHDKTGEIIGIIAFLLHYFAIQNKPDESAHPSLHSKSITKTSITKTSSREYRILRSLCFNQDRGISAISASGHALHAGISPRLPPIPTTSTDGVVGRRGQRAAWRFRPARDHGIYDT